MKIRLSKPGLKVIFNLRPFTRILSWGRDFKRGLDYQILNQMEALGLVVRKKLSKKEFQRKEFQRSNRRRPKAARLDHADV